MFEAIFEKVASFVDEFSLLKHQGIVILDFTVLPYDLIDEELDFDEEEYFGKLRELDEAIFNHIKKIITPGTSVTVLKRRVLFRGNIKLESKMIVGKNEFAELVVLMDVTDKFT